MPVTSVVRRLTARAYPTAWRFVLRVAPPHPAINGPAAARARAVPTKRDIGRIMPATATVQADEKHRSPLHRLRWLTGGKADPRTLLFGQLPTRGSTLEGRLGREDRRPLLDHRAAPESPSEACKTPLRDAKEVTARRAPQEVPRVVTYRPH